MADPIPAAEAAAPATPATPSAAASVDVQAQINQALAAQQAEFAKQLKAATGHSDLKGLAEAQLRDQGKLQELLDSKSKEADSYKSRFEASAITNAILAAAGEAIDPATVGALLAGKAVCDDNGAVTIDGKPVGDAVKQLLTDKPFLAKAQGGAGSGAPQQTAAAAKNPWTKEHFNLSEQIRIKNENPAQAALLKAAAG